MDRKITMLIIGTFLLVGPIHTIRMQDDAELYEKSSTLQTRDDLYILEEYDKQMKWKNNNDRVLDIGCGDGSVTAALKNYMPDNFEILVGCDVNENVVQYANEHHGDNRTKFMVLDIQGFLPNDLRENFDHIFSFYTLHWIKNQKKAFTNIYNLLSRDGACLLVFLGHMPLFTAMYALSKTTKWGPYLRTYNQFESPYHRFQEPAEYVTEMLENIGYQNLDVKCKQMKFVFSNAQILKNLIKAIEPFKIPKERLEEFLEDYIKVAREMRLADTELDCEASDSDSFTVYYNLIVVYGTK